MVRAGEGGFAAHFGGICQAHSAMTADIEKCAQFIVSASDDQYWLARVVMGEVLAGFSEHGAGSQNQWNIAEYGLLFMFEPLVIRVVADVYFRGFERLMGFIVSDAADQSLEKGVARVIFVFCHQAVLLHAAVVWAFVCGLLIQCFYLPFRQCEGREDLIFAVGLT